jgi:hypothetical protein
MRPAGLVRSFRARADAPYAPRRHTPVTRAAHARQAAVQAWGHLLASAYPPRRGDDAPLLTGICLFVDLVQPVLSMLAGQTALIAEARPRACRLQAAAA